MAAKVYRGVNTPEARAAREERLTPVISQMRGMSDSLAVEAEAGRLKMRRAVNRIRAKRGIPYYAGSTQQRKLWKLSGYAFAGRCAEYHSDGTDALPGHGR
jgi:hypothetical protein